MNRYCESALFGGFEDIGSIKRVETDLSNPTVMIYESSKFLGESLSSHVIKLKGRSHLNLKTSEFTLGY